MLTCSEAFFHAEADIAFDLLNENESCGLMKLFFYKCFIKKITIVTRGGVADTRIEIKAKDTKKSEAKAKDSLSEDRPLEAKDRNVRGQGLRTQAQVLSKKKK